MFVIPGILPLIPGIGLYNTMLSLIQKNYSLAMSKGTDALFLSAAIALGVLVVTSFVRTLNLLKIRKTLFLTENQNKNIKIAMYLNSTNTY